MRKVKLKRNDDNQRLSLTKSQTVQWNWKFTNLNCINNVHRLFIHSFIHSLSSQENVRQISTRLFASNKIK